MSNSAQHQLALVAEATYGTTPANPAMLRKLITACSLALTKGKIESNVIRPDRQVQDVRHGNRQIGGDIAVELTYDGVASLLEAVLCGTWTANVLVPGVTRRSFSVLRHFTDLVAPAKPYHLFKGVEFNTLGLSITPEALVTATFGCIGREVSYSDTEPAGTVYTAASTKKPFDSFTGSLLVDGIPMGDVSEITLNVENGMEPRFQVFDDRTSKPKAGKVRVTGQLTAYFASSDLLVAFNGGVKKALQFTLTDLEGNDFLFELPSIMLDGGQVDVEGENDITIPIPFSAIYEDGAPTPNALKITRTDA